MNKLLYLGLDPTNYSTEKQIIHFPIIKIIPITPQDPSISAIFASFSEYTHIIFTSKTTVKIILDYLPCFNLNINNLNQKICIAVGKITAKYLQSYGIHTPLVAKTETAEGILSLLSTQDIHNATLFWPHSALSRPVISDYMQKNSISFKECVMYNTLPYLPSTPLNWDEIDEIVFTSPSTVRAFVSFFGKIPSDKQLTSIGPITANELNTCLISPFSTK